MDTHGDQFILIRLVAGLMEKANHLWSDPVDAKGNELVAVRNRNSSVAQFADERGIYVKNTEGDELVRIQALKMFIPHFFREIQADVEHCHGELLLLVDPGEAQRIHF